MWTIAQKMVKIWNQSKRMGYQKSTQENRPIINNMWLCARTNKKPRTNKHKIAKKNSWACIFELLMSVENPKNSLFVSS